LEIHASGHSTLFHRYTVDAIKRTDQIYIDEMTAQKNLHINILFLLNVLYHCVI